MVTGFLTGLFPCAPPSRPTTAISAASNSLTFAYQPEGSTRGLKVYLCRHCGLVQSTPRIDRTQKRHAAAVSGGADWGNVRYGKGFRTQAAMETLARHARSRRRRSRFWMSAPTAAASPPLFWKPHRAPK